MSDDQVWCEQARVRAGWEQVDLFGRLTDAEAERMFSERFAAERTRAAETLRPLRPRPGQEALHATFLRGANLSRFRQTLDFVRPGDRVFEVGPGQGHLAALLLRDGEIATYHGIDLGESPLRKTAEFLDINGMPGRATLMRRDLYDLTRADIESLGVDLLVCCEVLEHVTDPERAMKNLASILPPGAELLISVPVLGRLEHVWGHLSIFDTARIRGMVAQAGLIPHAVHVVDKAWVLVLCSHDSRPSARAARAAAAAVDIFAARSPDGSVPTGFRPIDLQGAQVRPSRFTSTVIEHRVHCDSQGLACELTGGRSRWSGWWVRESGGVRLPVTDARGVRLEVGLDAIRAVTAMYVDACVGESRAIRWRWDVGARRPSRGKLTFVLRPGLMNSYFNVVRMNELALADAFDVHVAIRAGATAQFRIIRADAII